MPAAWVHMASIFLPEWGYFKSWKRRVSVATIYCNEICSVFLNSIKPKEINIAFVEVNKGEKTFLFAYTNFWVK